MQRFASNITLFKDILDHSQLFVKEAALTRTSFLQVTPKFCKQFAQIGEGINKALSDYKQEVENRSFPGVAYSPYNINPAEVDGFLKELQKMGLDKAATAAAEASDNFEAGMKIQTTKATN